MEGWVCKWGNSFCGQRHATHAAANSHCTELEETKVARRRAKIGGQNG